MPGIADLGNKCCGCGACEAICPFGCIHLIEDNCGFRYVSVDVGVCVECRRCESVCPCFKSGSAGDPSAFWAVSRDESQLLRSSSGGIFGELASEVLMSEGVVYGAAFDDVGDVVHVRVDDLSKLSGIMRSKYVQSTVSPNVYKALADDLESGKRVIYSGTACQVSAMASYVEANKLSRDNLLLINVICHGVPSPKLWGKWIAYLSRGDSSELPVVNFRSKSTGWMTYSIEYKFSSDDTISNPFSSDWYMKAFLFNASLRPSCFQCPSKRSCGSDITLGDFWGFQNIHPEIDDHLGVSAVLCSTDRGEAAFSALFSRIEHGLASFDEILAGNPCLVHSAMPYEKYDEFMTDLSSDCEIDRMIQRWKFDLSVADRVRRKVWSLLKRVCRLG